MSEKYVIKAMSCEARSPAGHTNRQTTVREGARDTFYTMLNKAREMQRSGMYSYVGLYKVLVNYEPINIEAE